MTGWTPLFQRIVCSSLWDQGDHVRLAWVTMLALATKEGVVPLKTPAAVSRMARIDLDKADDAIRVLSSPDPCAPEGDLKDGRRIEPHPNGWQIVKWSEYRELAKAAMRREANAGYQAKHREGKKQEETGPIPETTKRHEAARPILHYLNEKTGRAHRENENNLGKIGSRLAEDGVTPEGIRQMIDRQVALWKGDPKMDRYLTVDTLFGPENFDKYWASRMVPATPPPKKVVTHAV